MDSKLACNPPRRLKIADEKGILRHIGRFNLGASQSFDYWRCSDCNTDFPEIQGVIHCNGYAITDCPFCGTHSSRASRVS